jgi:formamidopyrimidine-DNA glycosylase
MPELPDLQVFSKNLSKTFVGKTLKKVTVRNSKKLKAGPGKLKKRLEGQKLTAVTRVGKELHFLFAKKDILALHLMLRGKLYTFENKNSEKYTIIELLFNDDFGLALTDFQGQANATLNPLERDAPDALSAKVNLSFLKDQLSKSKAKIKDVLLDQYVIRGIGNAYADEILWDARISPFSVANKIPPTGIKALLKSMKRVLQKAEKSILKSHPDIISGEVRDFMFIHNPDKKKSPKGADINIKKVGGRKTYFTAEQRLFR